MLEQALLKVKKNMKFEAYEYAIRSKVPLYRGTPAGEYA